MCDLGTVNLFGSETQVSGQSVVRPLSQTVLLFTADKSSYQVCDPTVQSCSPDFKVPTLFSGGVALATTFFLIEPVGNSSEDGTLRAVEASVLGGDFVEARVSLVRLSEMYRGIKNPEKSTEAAFWINTLVAVESMNPNGILDIFDKAESIYAARGDTESRERVITARARYFVSRGDSYERELQLKGSVGGDVLGLEWLKLGDACMKISRERALAAYAKADAEFARYEEGKNGLPTELVQKHLYVLDQLITLSDRNDPNDLPQRSDLYWKRAVVLERAGEGGFLVDARVSIEAIALLDWQYGRGFIPSGVTDWASVRTNNARRARRIGKYDTADANYASAIRNMHVAESSQGGSKFRATSALICERVEMWMEFGDSFARVGRFEEARSFYRSAISVAVTYAGTMPFVNVDDYIRERWDVIKRETGMDGVPSGVADVELAKSRIKERLERGIDPDLLRDRLSRLNMLLESTRVQFSSLDRFLAFAGERGVVAVVLPSLGEISEVDPLLLFDSLARATSAHSHVVDFGGTLDVALRSALTSAERVVRGEETLSGPVVKPVGKDSRGEAGKGREGPEDVDKGKPPVRPFK